MNASRDDGSAIALVLAACSGGDAQEDLADRHLELLAGYRRGDRGHLDDLVGDVPRGVLAAQPRLDLILDPVVQRHAVGQHDEHRHEELPARQVEVDHDRVVHLGDALEDVVDLGGADPHPEPVQRRVGTPEHEAAAAFVDLEEVALPPDAGPGVEVGGLVPGHLLVVAPELHRHRRHRLRDHHLADLVHDDLAVVVERVRRDAEVAVLVLAGVDGQRRGAAGEPAAHVGAAAAHVQPQVPLDVAQEPRVHLGRDRRPGQHAAP